MSIHIILGDPHIGKGCILGRDAVGSINSRIVDQINLLDWTLQQAVDRGAERIIITGDVFEDPKPHSSLIKIFLAWLNRCQDENIYVDVLYGNHDIIRTGKFVSSALDIVAEAGLPMVSLHSDIFTRSHLDQALHDIDFHKGRSPAMVLRRLRRLFQRAQPDERELRILRGILADAQRMARLAQPASGSSPR